MDNAINIVQSLRVRDVRAIFAEQPNLDMVLARHGITVGEFFSAYVLSQVLRKAASRK